MSDYFRQIAAQLGWTEETQIDVLLAYVQTHCPDGIQQYLQALVQTQAAAEGEQWQAEAENFFNRSLSSQLVQDRCQLVTFVSAQEIPDGGGHTIRCLVPDDGLQQIREWLRQPAPLPGYDPEGEIIFGYRLAMDNGTEAVFALTNSPHGPWIDAWLGEISLQPMRSIDEPFQFDWPDGTQLRFQFEPVLAAVQ